ncbi:hypothetical protein D3C76_1369570 [compost metagenome]
MDRGIKALYLLPHRRIREAACFTDFNTSPVIQGHKHTIVRIHRTAGFDIALGFYIHMQEPGKFHEQHAIFKRPLKPDNLPPHLTQYPFGVPDNFTCYKTGQ